MGLSDYTTRLLNVSLGAARAPRDSVPSGISVLRFLADSSRLASVSDDGTTNLWDTKTATAGQNWEELEITRLMNGSKLVTFSPDGNLLAYVSPAGVLLGNASKLKAIYRSSQMQRFRPPALLLHWGLTKQSASGS